MYFKLNASQEDYLLKQPETGMGYQVVEASKSENYSRQRGRVQPANGKRGGGKEVYFAKDTAAGTFLKQIPY